MDGIRLNIRTPRWFIIVALTPNSRVAGRDGKLHFINVERFR